METWEPCAPRWEKEHSAEVILKYKKKCKQFMNSHQHSSERKDFTVQRVLDFVYDSNRFEDAGVDKGKTEEIGLQLLKDCKLNITKPNLEERETINHFVAVKFAIESFPSKNEQLTIFNMCQLHEQLMEGIDESAGKLREKPACAGMDTQYPDPDLVPTLLEGVVTSFNHFDRNPDFSPFAKAAWLKCKFVEVHPFEDGNGRVSRILMNWVLYKYGYMFPVAIASDGHKQAKKHYMQSLKKAISGKNPGHFSYMILRSVYKSIEKFESVTGRVNNEDMVCKKGVNNTSEAQFYEKSIECL